MAALLAAASNNRDKLNIVAQIIMPPFLPSLDMSRPPAWPPTSAPAGIRHPTQLTCSVLRLKPSSSGLSCSRGEAGLDQAIHVPITRLPRVAARAAKY